MAGSFEVNGGKTTVTFAYTADTDKVSEVVGLCAERLYVDRRYQNLYGEDGDLVPFEALTNSQKLAVVDTYLREVIINVANQKKADDAAEAARQAEEALALAFD